MWNILQQLLCIKSFLLGTFHMTKLMQMNICIQEMHDSTPMSEYAVLGYYTKSLNSLFRLSLNVAYEKKFAGFITCFLLEIMCIDVK
jgi:hypothetical protein